MQKKSSHFSYYINALGDETNSSRHSLGAQKEETDRKQHGAGFVSHIHLEKEK